MWPCASQRSGDAQGAAVVEAALLQRTLHGESTGAISRDSATLWNFAFTVLDVIIRWPINAPGMECPGDRRTDKAFQKRREKIKRMMYFPMNHYAICPEGRYELPYLFIYRRSSRSFPDKLTTRTYEEFLLAPNRNPFLRL